MAPIPAPAGGKPRGPGTSMRFGLKSGRPVKPIGVAVPGAPETFCTHVGQPLGALANRGAKLRPMRWAVARSETSVRTYQTVTPPLVPRYSGSVATLLVRSIERALLIVRLARGRSPASCAPAPAGYASSAAVA